MDAVMWPSLLSLEPHKVASMAPMSLAVENNTIRRAAHAIGHGTKAMLSCHGIRVGRRSVTVGVKGIAAEAVYINME